MRRLCLLICVLALAAPSVALGQDGGGSGAFGPLPPAAPEPPPAPTADPTVEAQQQTDRTLLFVIAGGLVVLFIVIGRVITRDAKHALKESGHREEPQLREDGPHRHAKQTKAKARAKGKAQKRARRANR